MYPQSSDKLSHGIHSRRSIAIEGAVCMLLGIHAVMLCWMAWRYSPTIDEPAHLVAGLSHWKDGRFDLYRVNPPLVRLVAALPMLLVEPKIDWSGLTEAPYTRPEFTIGTVFAHLNGIETFWHFTLARWACIPFSVIGGYFCFRWSRELYGARSGIMCLMLWCFCPNILGNGALITPDVPAAAVGLMANYFFWRWLRIIRALSNRTDVKPDSSSRQLARSTGWRSALLAGFTLGLAELTKSTWIILFAVWPLIWAVSKCRYDPAAYENLNSKIPTGQRMRFWRDAGFTQLTAILLIALYTLNLGYGFENSFERLDKFNFISHVLGGPGAHKTPGNRFTNTLLGALPVPVPANYLRGLDVQRYDFEVGKWSYLRGEQKMGGWWYYYFYAMAVKIPAGTLFLIVVATVMSTATTINAVRKQADDSLGCASRHKECNPASPMVHPQSSMLDSVAILLPALTVLFLVSSQTGFNRHLRYVIPAFPFLFIWASQVAQLSGKRATRGLGPTARDESTFDRQASMLNAGIVFTLLVAIASSLAVFPHSLSYFNEFAGGPAKGPDHLLDANVDWGQDLLYLKEWYDAHPEARPLHFAYFGRVTPKSADVDFVFQARFPRVALHQDQQTGRELEKSGPQSQLALGWYAVSVNNLHGYKHDGGEDGACTWLKQCRPVASAGYSIRIYHAAPE